MTDFVEVKNSITDILMRAGQKDIARKFHNTMLMGGTDGERFTILLSLTKVNEISNPDVFDLIKVHAKRLYDLADKSNWQMSATLIC
jgi:hypothetical protein